LLGMMRRRYLVIPVALALVGCAGQRLDLSQSASQEAVYLAAMEAYRRGKCEAAVQGFERLAGDAPGGESRRVEAQYYTAECSLAGGRQVEAAREFRRVVEAFPQHALAPDALLRAGDSYAQLWRKPELDPTFAETARATYQELLQRFPGSAAARRAQVRIGQLNEMFAEKEYRSGVFYQRMKAYDSAIIYFREVVARYPQSRHAPRAVIRLAEVYSRLQYDEERAEMCQYLQRFYPGDMAGAKPCAAGQPAP